MVWSAINGASEKLKGSCEGTVSLPLSQSLVLNMCVQQCARAPPINICSLGFITQWYYRSVLRVFSPNFLERKAQVTVTIRVRQSALYILQLSIGRRFCRIKRASETISESLKFQNFLGGHTPDPPTWRASRVWEPNQTGMASAGPISKLPSLQHASLL